MRIQGASRLSMTLRQLATRLLFTVVTVSFRFLRTKRRPSGTTCLHSADAHLAQCIQSLLRGCLER